MWHARATWLAIAAAALAFRLPYLRERPMHADEAVLADKFGSLLETGSYPYDPHEFHGPALAWLTLIPARIMGQRRYGDLTETTLRMAPALCGALLVMLPLLVSGGLGRRGAMAAAALTAISPAMVYYSRYYIPEMLLTTLAFLTIACGYRYACSGAGAWAVAAGASAGLMFAAKETAAIAAACMLVAVAATARPKAAKLWQCALGAGVAVAIPLVTFGFANCWSAATSYAQRALHPAVHLHPWYYYPTLLGAEILVPILALLAIVGKPDADARLPRFLAVYACAMALVYSLIPYKTPWCLLGPLHAMILLAGVAAASLLEGLRGRARIVAGLLLAAWAAQLGYQAWRASFPWSSDPRNPYAYAHTTRDVYAIRDAMIRVAAGRPGGFDAPVQVIGAGNMWPLPWYLRSFPHVEWWRLPGAGYRPADMILVTPDMEPALAHELYEVPPPGSRELYLSLFDRIIELRPGVEMRGYVRASVAK